MSIIIKGMKMPTARDTLVLVKTDGTAIVYVDEAYVTTAYPVPPHGRLIDADALTDDLEFDIRNDKRVIDELRKDLPDGFIDIRIATTQDDKDIKQNCIVLLREQPTIIEAEEEEKNESERLFRRQKFE